jgi:PAS domain S-box-containing protein
VKLATPPGGPRRVRLALLASVAAGAALALAVELTYLASTGSPAQTSAAVPIVAVVVGTAGLLIAAALARNEDAARRQGLRVQQIGDPAIDALEDEEVLATITQRLRDVLQADKVVVLLQPVVGDDQGGAGQGPATELAVVGASGLGPAAATSVPAGSFPASAAAATHHPPPRLPPGWSADQTAVTRPVTRGQQGISGMVYVGFRDRRGVSTNDEALVDLAAGRVWSVVHRRRLVDAERRARLSAEGARRQLAVLADTGSALGSALTHYDEEVAALAGVCVPVFADLCAIDLIDDQGRLQPAVVRYHPAAGLELPKGPQWRELLDQTLAEGHTRFGYTGGNGTGDEVAEQVMGLMAASSVLMVPVQAGGLSLGTITMATGAARRGFRSSDAAVAEDLGNRLAVAVQRVQLHREAVGSAEAQARTARRLRRLTDAAITLAGTARPEHLLDAAADEVRRVVQASSALVVSQPADQPEARVRSGPPDHDALDRVADAAISTASLVAEHGCLAAPLLDRHQVCRGALAVAARPGATLNADDEVALVSLAHLVALVVAQAELTAAVAAREARMLALIEASPLAILRLSPEAVVVEGNPAARALFGWPAGATTGPLPESLAEQLCLLTVRAAKGEAIGDAEVQGESRAGEPLDLVVAAAPVGDEGGPVEAVLLMVADVSQRRQAERQLQQAQRLEAMGQVAGGVAHDFNNLLTVIVGYTEALLAATDDDDPTRPLLESIERAGAGAAALTHQLLGLAGRRAAHPVPVGLGELVAELETVLSRLVGVDIDVVVDVDLVGTVLADPGELEQLVLNLSFNARDAMPDGGRLELKVRRVHLGPAEAEEQRLQPGPYVCLTVADTGTGMDAETTRRCFEPFFTSKERGRGTGLGLAAVYSVATEGGGAVAVSSQVGRGTTFRVWLPSTDEQAKGAAGELDEPWPTGTGRVLLVEDEIEIRELARRTLEESGFTVVVAANAAAAMVAFEEASAPFDVLVSDIVMPGMRGTELAGLLLQRQPSLEVLYVSGYTGAGPQSGDDIDGVSVLRKPFRGHELCRRVARLSERAASKQRQEIEEPSD